MYNILRFLVVLLCTVYLTAASTSQGINYPVFPNDFQWSSQGIRYGKDCLQVNEPKDPHTWHDNYLCWKSGTINPGLTWSHQGPIPGQRCTLIYEAADSKHTWMDNYLCVAPNTPYAFSWSSTGPILGLSCIQWIEKSDPHTWTDNYLCAPKKFTPGQLT